MTTDAKKQRAEKAATALRAVGLKSAGAEHDYVCLSPDDAMRMLLLTYKDGEKLIKHERRIRASMIREMQEIRAKMDRLGRLTEHSPDLCEKGDHILDSWETGGRNGHVRTVCLACDYRQDGYD